MVGGINAVRDRGLDFLLERRPLFVRYPVDFRGARFEGGGQNIFRSRLRDEVVHLDENFFHDEMRRQNPFLLAKLQALEQLVELRADRVQALPVIFAVPRREQPVGVRHEGREFVLDAEELVYRVVVELILFAFDLAAHVPLEDVSGELLGRVLFLERIGVKVFQVFPGPIEVALLMSRRHIAQFSVVAGDAEPFHEPERREKLRLFEEHLGEDLFIKQIQAPGPEPDEIDEEDGERDHQQRQDPQRPFQNASEHSESVACAPLPRSILYPPTSS